MAKKSRPRASQAKAAEGICLKGPDGKLYFIPTDQLQAFLLPEPMQPGSGSEISEIIEPALQDALEKKTVIEIKSVQVGPLITILGK